MRTEFSSKLVNDLLHNEDAMSMAHSAESRVPWLDLEFVRFSAQIPAHIRFSGGMKGIIKQALAETIPTKVLQKKKWGFTFDPVEQFRKDLKPLAQEVLSESRVRDRKVFNYKFIADILKARPHPDLRWHYFMLWQMIGIEYCFDIFVDQTEH